MLFSGKSAGPVDAGSHRGANARGLTVTALRGVALFDAGRHTITNNKLNYSN